MKNNIVRHPMTVWTRVYPCRQKSESKKSGNRNYRQRQLAVKYGGRTLLFDFESRDESGQRMTFGSFQLRNGATIDEIGLIVGDHLTKRERRCIAKFAARRGYRVYSRDEFGELLRIEVQQIGSICVGFNLCFDLSRGAYQWGECNGENTGAFNLHMERNTFRPIIRLKHRDRRSSIIKYAPGNKMEVTKGHHEGYFIDCHTLVAALTDESMTLERAAKHYGVKAEKQKVTRHGVVTRKYIEYNLNDVQVTWEVYCAAMEDYTRLGIDLPPHSAMSTATIGKGHFDKMDIKPRSICQPDFPRAIDGYAMEAYYGGRVEGHWPNEVVPVTYLDVLSMYPTVFVLQGLWWWVVAERLEPYECADDVRAFLERVTIDDLMRPETWLIMPKLVLIEPDDDRLPVRAEYVNDGDLQIGLNYLKSSEASWYTLADAVVSKLRTGRVPKICRAIGIETFGTQPGLKPMKIRGISSIDPRSEDFFAEVIGQRAAINAQPTPLSSADKAQQQFLKIIANSTGYGIFAEFNESFLEDPERIEVFAGKRFTTETDIFEKAGRYCFPFIASCVTGAARLVLALVETKAADLGASYAFCDTDSFAVIDPDETVGDKLVEEFCSLNPYRFGGSILKLEPENFDAITGERRKLIAIVKASKRYALFNIDPRTGRPILRKALEHGLGHLVPPHGETRGSWIKQFWYYIACQALRIRCKAPRWFTQVAVAQLTISTPHLIQPVRSSTSKQTRHGAGPFNFMMVGYADGLASPTGLCRKHKKPSIGCRDATPCKYRKSCPLVKPIRPVTKYDRTMADPTALPWIDGHTGLPISVEHRNRRSGRKGRVALKTFGDIYSDFVQHIDRKAALPNGAHAEPDSRGELQPLYSFEAGREYTGKEARNIELAEVFGDTTDRYITYEQGWSVLKQRLREHTLTRIIEMSGLSKSQIYALLAERSHIVPERTTTDLLAQALEALKARRGPRSR